MARERGLGGEGGSRPRRQRCQGVFQGIPPTDEGPGETSWAPRSGSGAKPPTKTDFSAFQASKNATRWYVCHKLTSCQKTFIRPKGNEKPQHLVVCALTVPPPMDPSWLRFSLVTIMLLLSAHWTFCRRISCCHLANAFKLETKCW